MMRCLAFHFASSRRSFSPQHEGDGVYNAEQTRLMRESNLASVTMDIFNLFRVTGLPEVLSSENQLGNLSSQTKLPGHEDLED